MSTLASGVDNLCTYINGDAFGKSGTVKYVINGRAFPSGNGVCGQAEAWDQLQESLGQLNDLNAESILDYQSYISGDTNQYGWNGGLGSIPQFILGQDFQKADSRATGVDTAVLGGLITINVHFSAAPTACQMLSFLHYDRGLLIKSNGIVISE